MMFSMENFGPAIGVRAHGNPAWGDYAELIPAALSSQARPFTIYKGGSRLGRR